MKWSDELATGILSIDEQHKMLFKMVDDFRNRFNSSSPQAALTALLGALERYVRLHFSFEEGCMERYRCPVAQRNKEEHEKLVRYLEEFKQRQAFGGVKYEDVAKLMQVLENWLVNHIGRVDVQLKHCVKKQGN
jgi:hemerythrin-like metal-binding domain